MRTHTGDSLLSELSADPDSAVCVWSTIIAHAHLQLLRYVHERAPRGIYTSGKGSSAVGLTASIVKDPETREPVLESE